MSPPAVVVQRAERIVKRPRGPWATTVVDLSGSVYGTILASSLVVALGYRGGNAGVMIAALVVTELVFATAHSWSSILATGAARGSLPSAADVSSALRHEWPVVQATWPAIISLLLAVLGVYSTDTAVDVALAANAVVLFLWGVALARLQGLSVPKALAAGLLTGVLGVLLVVLKVLVK